VFGLFTENGAIQLFRILQLTGFVMTNCLLKGVFYIHRLSYAVH